MRGSPAARPAYTAAAWVTWPGRVRRCPIGGAGAGSGARGAPARCEPLVAARFPPCALRWAPGAGAAHCLPALAPPREPGQPSVEQVRLEQARALAKQNPIAVANIVKTWINGEAP